MKQFISGQKVYHAAFGTGIVRCHIGLKVTIDFHHGSVGRKIVMQDHIKLIEPDRLLLTDEDEIFLREMGIKE